MSANEQKRATRANQRMAEDTNAMNYRMYRESRGDGGNAFLPTYFGDFEDKMLADSAKEYFAASQYLLGNPWEQAGRYRETMAKYQPMMDASDRTIAGIYNGDLANERRAYLAPVAQARLNAAGGQREAIKTGLQQTLNEMKAMQKQAGFSGTGSFAQNRMLNATIGANQQAALAQSNAGLQNAMDMRSIGDTDIAGRISAIDLPYNRAQQAVAFQEMPIDLMQSNFSRSVRPFEFFRLGQGQFRYDPLPMQGANNVAAAGLAAVGAGNQQLAALLMQQQQNQNLARQAEMNRTYANINAYGAAGGFGAGNAAAGGALGNTFGGWDTASAAGAFA